MKDAEVTPAQIGLIVSHGMGDPVIDAAESEAIKATLPDTPVTATIAALGHTGAASGTIDVVTAAMALATQTIPPTIGADRHTSTAAVENEPVPLEGSHVLCLSHTSEGNATAVILAQP